MMKDWAIMLFGTRKKSISAFLPRVLSHIDGIDVDMVSTYIMDSIINFLRDTKILTEIFCFSLEECIDSYKITTANYATEVLSVRFFVNGVQRPNHKFKYRIDGDTFYLETPPACIGTVDVEVELAVAPPRDSLEVPEFLYEEWIEAITALTLSKLYLLTDNEWYNPQAANNQMVLYQQFVRQARFTKITKHKPFNMRLTNKRRL